MAKDWKTIYTNTDKTRKTDFKAFNKLIRNTVSLSTFELKKHGNELYDKRIVEEDKLIAAVEEGRATKPELIEKANTIKEARARTKTEKSKKKEKDNGGK